MHWVMFELWNWQCWCNSEQIQKMKQQEKIQANICLCNIRRTDININCCNVRKSDSSWCNVSRNDSILYIALTKTDGSRCNVRRTFNVNLISADISLKTHLYFVGRGSEPVMKYQETCPFNNFWCSLLHKSKVTMKQRFLVNLHT